MDLTALDASNEDITNIEGIEYAVNLEELNLGEIYLAGTEGRNNTTHTEVTDDGIKQLPEAKSLKKLDLRGTEVTYEGIEHLDDEGIDIRY